MCWLDALEISIRNDSALVRSVSNKSASGNTTHETQWSESDYEKHFDHGKCKCNFLNLFCIALLFFLDLDDISQPDNGVQLSTGEMSDSDSEISAKEDDFTDEEIQETHYFANHEEEFGDVSFLKAFYH